VAELRGGHSAIARLLFFRLSWVLLGFVFQRLGFGCGTGSSTAGREGAKTREGRENGNRQRFSRLRVFAPSRLSRLRVRQFSSTQQRGWKTNRRRTQDELKKGNSPRLSKDEVAG
jgi:hypothetical protein